MTARFDCVGFGEPLVVMVPDRAGPLRTVPRFERALGGAECNVLTGLARLGARCGLISRVGSDEFGAFVISALGGAHIDASAVAVDDSAPTGLYFKEVSAFRDRSSATYYRRTSAATLLSPASVDRTYLQGARSLITTGITALLSAAAYEGVGAALATAREVGCTTVFDPNLRAGLWGSDRAVELLPPLIGKADIYMGGHEETEVLLETTGTRRELARLVHDLGPREVVIRDGADGALALTEDGWAEEPAFPVVVQDPIGAGDAFNAGYLHFRQAGASADEALRAGVICASSVCAGAGDFEMFPRRIDLAYYMRQVSAAAAPDEGAGTVAGTVISRGGA